MYLAKQSALLLILFVIVSFKVNANGIAEYGDATHQYEVHYSVFNSSFLQPNIAKAHGISRAPNIAVANIAVRRKLKDSDSGKKTVATISRVQGHIHNLLGQKRELSFSEVREQEAIYYLAQFRFGDKETLTFNLELMPDMRLGPVNLKFTKEMYID